MVAGEWVVFCCGLFVVDAAVHAVVLAVFGSLYPLGEGYEFPPLIVVAALLSGGSMWSVLLWLSGMGGAASSKARASGVGAGAWCCGGHYWVVGGVMVVGVVPHSAQVRVGQAWSVGWWSCAQMVW